MEPNGEVAGLPGRWREQAQGLDPYAPQVARMLLDKSQELEDALRHDAEELLTLAQAVLASGYSERQLRAKIASGDIPNAGRKGKPMIRRRDLPRRTIRLGIGTFNAQREAQELLERASRGSR